MLSRRSILRAALGAAVCAVARFAPLVAARIPVEVAPPARIAVGRVVSHWRDSGCFVLRLWRGPGEHVDAVVPTDGAPPPLGAIAYLGPELEVVFE